VNNTDIENLSKDELENRLVELEDSANRYFNYEQSVKRILNSIYGAFGNQWFYFFNIDIAESITLQGQDAILYSEKMLNIYITDFWHKDIETHKKMGITVTGKCKKPGVIYIDTDSCYVTFAELIDNSDWSGEPKEFIKQLHDIRLKDYLEKVMTKYAEVQDAPNFLSFEMESIAHNAIWLAKKKYIQNIVWTDPDLHFDKLSKIKTKGFEIIQSSTPLFARNKLKDALSLFFAQDKPELAPIVNFLKEAKKEFQLANKEDITFSLKTNNYDKYIVEDYNQLEFLKGCPINVRAAGHHNYLLNNSKYKGKYDLIGNGEKLKMYHCKDNLCNVFSFSPGNHPYEFAPEVDYELQFEKCMIDPLNRVISAIGLQTLDRNLVYSATLF
tara:strand:+ start:152 stop:1306 length:1155 start_codon:yes stop_codon:yes gene_type:complete